MKLIDLLPAEQRRDLRRLRKRLAKRQYMRRVREERKLLCAGVDLPIDAGTCGRFVHDGYQRCIHCTRRRWWLIKYAFNPAEVSLAVMLEDHAADNDARYGVPRWFAAHAFSAADVSLSRTAGRPRGRERRSLRRPGGRPYSRGRRRPPTCAGEVATRQPPTEPRSSSRPARAKPRSPSATCSPSRSTRPASTSPPGSPCRFASPAGWPRHPPAPRSGWRDHAGVLRPEGASPRPRRQGRGGPPQRRLLAYRNRRALTVHAAGANTPRTRATPQADLLAHPPAPVDDTPSGSLEQRADSTRAPAPPSP